jgi:hypothetical protein
MDPNFDHQMSLSKSKCWYSNNCLHFLKRAVPLDYITQHFQSLNSFLQRQNVVGTNACNGCTQVTALTLVPWVSRQQICSCLAQGAKVSKSLAVDAAILTD